MPSLEVRCIHHGQASVPPSVPNMVTAADIGSIVGWTPFGLWTQLYIAAYLPWCLLCVFSSSITDLHIQVSGVLSHPTTVIRDVFIFLIYDLAAFIVSFSKPYAGD